VAFTVLLLRIGSVGGCGRDCWSLLGFLGGGGSFRTVISAFTKEVELLQIVVGVSDVT
jgi:hypothetical protein